MQYYLRSWAVPLTIKGQAPQHFAWESRKRSKVRTASADRRMRTMVLWHRHTNDSSSDSSKCVGEFSTCICGGNMVSYVAFHMKRLWHWRAEATDYPRGGRRATAAAAFGLRELPPCRSKNHGIHRIHGIP